MQDFFEKNILSAENLYIFILNSNLIKGRFMTEQSNNTEQSEYKPKWYDLEGINQKNVGSFLGFLTIIITLDISFLAGNIYLGMPQYVGILITILTLISIIATMVLYLQFNHFQGCNYYPKGTGISFILSLAPTLFISETFIIMQITKLGCWEIIISTILATLIIICIYKKVFKNINKQ